MINNDNNQLRLFLFQLLIGKCTIKFTKNPRHHTLSQINLLIYLLQRHQQYWLLSIQLYNVTKHSKAISYIHFSIQANCARVAEGLSYICLQDLKETNLKDLIMGLRFSVVLIITQNKNR